MWPRLSLRRCRNDFDPDELQGQLYREEVELNIKQGATLAFAHVFTVHSNQVLPHADLSITMIAPKAHEPLPIVSLSMAVVFQI
jgi:hypothetical protein